MSSIIKKSIGKSVGIALLASVLAPVVPAFAQSLDEIVVTAQRREQNLLDVPVAVTTFNTKELIDSGVEDILDLNFASPSVFSNTVSSTLSNSPVRIRGIGTSGGNPGFESAVGIYVDDVYRSRPGTALATLFDMAGLDILRGPQGTLFGKNTTAGALLLKTAAPVIGENSVSLGLNLGDYGTRKIDTAINFAINDTAAIRISGMHGRKDGYFNDGSGNDTAKSENDGLRVQLGLELTDSLNVRVIADYSSYFNTDNYTRFVTHYTGGSNGTRGDTVDIGEEQPFSFTHPVTNIGDNTINQAGLSVIVNYEISDNLSLKSVTSYREIDSDNEDGDWDFGGEDRANSLDVFHDMETITQEFLLEGSADLIGRNFDYVAGVNYFAEELDYARQATANQINPFFASDSEFKVQDYTAFHDEESFGLFVHGTYSLTEQLSLIAGVRYTEVEKTYEYTPLSGTPEEYFANVRANAAFFLARDTALQTAQPWNSTVNNEETTFDITLQYRPTDNMQLFAKFSEGFKAGGFNVTENAAAGEPSYPTNAQFNALPLALQTPFQYLLEGRGRGVAGDDYTFGDPTFAPFTPETGDFAPEYVESFELGYRLEYGDKRGRLSVVYFYSDFEDLQVSVFNGTAFEVVNAGTSSTTGFEIENIYALTEALTINAGVTFLDTEYGDDVQGLPAGRERGLAPDVAGVVGLRYEDELLNDINLYANFNYSFYTEMYLAEGGLTRANSSEPGVLDPLAQSAQDDYGLLSLSVGLRKTDNWDISVYCGNCTDEEYYTFSFNRPFFYGEISSGLGDPQTFGMRLRKDF